MRGLVVAAASSRWRSFATLFVWSCPGLVIVRQVADAIPPWSFVADVGVLALLATLMAAMLPALLAARRDPVRVLRVP